MRYTIPLQPADKIPYLRKPLHIAYTVLFVGFWVYTGLTTTDYLNWVLENTLTLSLLIFIVAFYNIFRFSDTSYSLIFLFLLLHVYGSQYQYADNPFGEWLKQEFALQRNHYDRLVHLGFGLLLSYPMYEALAYGLRVNPLLSHLLPVELVLSLGAVYELVEWIVADLVYEGAAQGMNYLGMQGDIWDAQKDIALGFAGSLVAMGITFIIRKRKRQL